MSSQDQHHHHPISSLNSRFFGVGKNPQILRSLIHTMITRCVGRHQEEASPIPLKARHANNAAGHDSLVEPRHDWHDDDLQLLLPGLIFLCFGTQIVLASFDGGVDLGLTLSAALSETSIFSVVFSSERVPSSLESFWRRSSR